MLIYCALKTLIVNVTYTVFAYVIDGKQNIYYEMPNA